MVEAQREAWQQVMDDEDGNSGDDYDDDTWSCVVFAGQEGTPSPSC